MGYLGRLNIAGRLAVGFGIVLSLGILSTGYGMWRMHEIAMASQALGAPLAKERMIAEWNTLVFGAVRRTGAIVKSTDPGVAAYFKDEMEDAVKRSAALSKRIEPLLTTPAEAALLRQIDVQRQRYRDATAAAMKAKAQGNHALADQILTESFVPAAAGFQNLLEQMLALQHRQMDAQNHAILDIETSSMRLVAILTGIAVLTGAACAWLLAAGIVRPLRSAVSIARTVASGDLTQTIDAHGHDETATLLHALREMNGSLAAIVKRVRDGTSTIATASEEISAGNLDLSSRTEQQASALQETAASMEQLTSTVGQNATDAQEASKLSRAASAIASEGGTVVSQVVATMSAIDTSARKIADITAVIDGIAFQTNILALNAAVEAARAGEQGRGFAVVAGEVRNLAQRSATAAKEIKALINESADQVEAGTQLAGQAGATMSRVVDSIQQVTGMVNAIAAASREQSDGIGQVSQAVAQIDQVTQQNAALVEEAAAAASAMREQAARLAQSVQVFTVDASIGRERAPSHVPLLA
jgi:methyl-accepting chemotaxis protein